MLIGDVGQNQFEEIDFAREGDSGLNFGWRRLEGKTCFKPPSGCRTIPTTDPVIVLDHSKGRSVTGGYVYRGSNIPCLQGKYLFSDYVQSVIRVADVRPGRKNWTWKQLQVNTAGIDLKIASFSEDNDGELYVVSLVVKGAIYKLVPA